jgi:hypothetical protein
MSAAEEIPDDLELVPDDLELVDDAHTPEKEYVSREAGFAADRQKGTDAQRAMNALNKLKAGGELAPDERQALKTALAGNFGRRGDTPMGALEAANLKGIQGAMLGHADEVAGGARAGVKKLQGDKRPFTEVYRGERDTVRGAMKQAERDHPVVSALSEAAGGTPTMLALPGGLGGALGTGAIAGAGAAESSMPQDLYPSAALGAGLGAAGYAAGTYGPALVKRALEGTKGAAGRGMQKLAQLLGEKPIASPEAPGEPSIAASLEEHLADAAAANRPRPQSPAPVAEAATAAAPAPRESTGSLMMRELQDMQRREMTPDKFDGYASEVNAQALKNDPELAKMRAPKMGDDALAKLQAMFEEKGLQPKPYKPGDNGTAVTKVLPQEAPPQDTSVMSLYDALHMDDVPGMPHDDGLPVQNWMEGHQAKGPSQRAAATFDNANKAMDEQALDRIVKGGEAPAPVSDARQRIIDAQMQNPEALAAFGGQQAGPGKFGTKEKLWQQLKDAAGVDDYDASAADAAYAKWKAGMGPKPAPFEGGHFDEINRMLDLKGDKRVSGGREALDLLTRGEKGWDEVNTAIKALNTVPGLEKLRVPDHVQDALLPRDPRAGERGFIGLGDAYAGVKALGKAADVAAPLMNKAGAAMENSAQQAMTPDAQARSYISNPSVLFHLARQKGEVGGAAKAMLQALQAGDQQALKARAALLATLPEFRQMFAQGRASEGPPASIAR